jgi:hypothetical protein
MIALYPPSAIERPKFFLRVEGHDPSDCFDVSENEPRNRRDQLRKNSIAYQAIRLQFRRA